MERLNFVYNIIWWFFIDVYKILARLKLICGFHQSLWVKSFICSHQSLNNEQILFYQTTRELVAALLFCKMKE